MAYQAVFRRYELKYLLTEQQKQAVLSAMESHMALDRYGRTTIRNLYYDTDNYLLIRRSIEKPVYKEKLRVRCYGPAAPEDKVFVELKKKYDGVVYKRRISLPQQEAMAWLSRSRDAGQRNQISAEVDYFLDHYRTLKPRVFLSYEREAYYARDGSDFRVTFDDTVLCRQEDLSLSAEIGGTPLLPDGLVLMELKCAGGIPMWMTRVLSSEGIRKTSFSKYGTAYKNMIFPQLQKSEVISNDR